MQSSNQRAPLQRRVWRHTTFSSCRISHHILNSDPAERINHQPPNRHCASIAISSQARDCTYPITMAEPSEQTPPVDTGAHAEDTPRSMDPSQDEDIKSKKVSLADLSAKGTALYAHKNYEEAADVFSRASIVQAEINGETAPENAEILFHYGRSLFKVGQSKSDVLGGSAPTTDKKAGKSGGQPKPAKPARPAQTGKEVTQEGVDIVADEKGSESKSSESNAHTAEEKEPTANKPFFQFTGDENFDDSDDDDEVIAAQRAHPELGLC